MSKMKPILFSGPMVQAILDGRKTMTRRVAKPCRGEVFRLDPLFKELSIFKQLKGSIGMSGEYRTPVPRYKVGDILWVRETWQPLTTVEGRTVGYHFATGQVAWICDTTGMDIQEPDKWRPSIFMPKTAARIFLKVTEIRVERLQEISEEDAISEGVPVGPMGDYRTGFYWIWEHLNGKRGYGWDTNPWVFGYKFERCERPQEDTL